jgi:predicted ArsR family transcriptional regulator
MSRPDLTTAQVAERMGVSVHAVRFWIKRGLLPNAYELAETRGSVWMIPAGDLKSFTPPKKTGRPPKAKGNGATKKAAKKGGKK